MTAPVRLAILGATGSIGLQTLDVVRAHPQRFRVVGLAASRQSERMASLVREFCPDWAVLEDDAAAAELRGRFRGTGLMVESGAAALEQAVCAPDVDLLVSASVGRSGLRPTLAAVQAGKRIALACKEVLVMAGGLVQRERARSGSQILPIDSEHAALHQALAGVKPDAIHSLLLTASGGPFLGCSRAELEGVDRQAALAHPRWSMGAKITIDSASLINKGFEVIEAHWLFGLQPDRIRVLIHPESIVHGLVEMVDGSLLAQLGPTDMRIPIAYALAYPQRLELPGRVGGLQRLDLASLGHLGFLEPDHATFPGVRLCRAALAMGGGAPAALSVADEVVVEAFLAGRLRFPAIAAILEEVVERLPSLTADSLEDVWEAGRVGEHLAEECLQKRLV